MPENPPVRLRKAVGGSTLTWEGEQYTWPAGDSPVCEVPYDFALELLRDPNREYSVDGEALHVEGSEGAPGSVQSAADAGLADSREGAPQKVTEPDEGDDEHEVTEPAPKSGKSIAEGGENTGSKITPRPQAGTRQRSK